MNIIIYTFSFFLSSEIRDRPMFTCLCLCTGKIKQLFPWSEPCMRQWECIKWKKVFSNPNGHGAIAMTLYCPKNKGCVSWSFEARLWPEKSYCWTIHPASGPIQCSYINLDNHKWPPHSGVPCLDSVDSECHIVQSKHTDKDLKYNRYRKILH